MDRCRDCQHWLCHNREQLAKYPRNQPWNEGWLDGVCLQLHRNLTFTVSGGWDDVAVESVATDANFGCVLFEPNKKLTQ